MLTQFVIIIIMFVLSGVFVLKGFYFFYKLLCFRIFLNIAFVTYDLLCSLIRDPKTYGALFDCLPLLGTH